MIQSVTISDQALNKLSPYRQDLAWEPESGGILLGHVDDETAYIEDVTFPQRDDMQERRAFEPDLPEHFEAGEPACGTEGNCYIGEWHSHPEKRPEPSAADLHLFAERSNALGRDLVFLIIGMYEDGHDRFFVAGDGEVFEMKGRKHHVRVD